MGRQTLDPWSDDDPRVRVTLSYANPRCALRHRGAVVSRLLEEHAQQPGHPALKRNA